MLWTKKNGVPVLFFTNKERSVKDENGSKQIGNFG